MCIRDRANVKSIAWDDPADAVVGFLTIAIMPLTYNISYGIAFGLISYVFIKMCIRDRNDASIWDRLYLARRSA